MTAIELYSTKLINDPDLLLYLRLEGNGNDALGICNLSDYYVAYHTDYGKFNQGIAVDAGSPGKIFVPSGKTSPFRQTVAISYCSWVIFPSTGYPPKGFYAGVSSTGGQGSGKVLFTPTSFIFPWTVTDGGGGSESDRSLSASFSTLSSDVLHHFTFSVNFSTMTYFLMIDGVLRTLSLSSSVTDGTPKSSPYDRDGSSGVEDAIGGYYTNSWNYATCRFDDFALFKRQLTIDEANALYTGDWKTDNYLKISRRRPRMDLRPVSLL